MLLPPHRSRLCNPQVTSPPPILQPPPPARSDPGAPTDQSLALPATLSLRSIGSPVGDKECAVWNVRGEGDLKDDAVSEWTGSEDLHTSVETTGDPHICATI